jgi:hypothetical protein
MGLILSLDNSIHSFNRAGFVGLLDEYTGAAAGYSLRKLSVNTTDVVRVRRSSDNAEADFTAAEVADGTLENWVNTDVVIYESDFSSTEDFSEFNGTGEASQSIGGVNDAYKFTLSGGNNQHFAYKSGLHSIGKQYSITADVYIPSANVNCDGVVLSLFGSQDLISTNTLDQWVTLTSTYTANYANLNFFALDGASKTLNADGDVFYLKNIVVTQTTADGHVTTWYDQSGNGNNATQATAANQPKIVDAGVLVEENGKPAVSFDGVDDYFTDISGVMGGSVNGIMISVHKTNDGVTTFDSCQISEPSPVLIPIVGNNVVSYAHLTSTRRIFATSDNFYDRQLLVIRQNYNSNHALYINGSLIDSQTDSVSYTDTLKIGRVKSAASFAYYNNNLQEIIIYNSDQSSNRTNIETNINDHYSIYP